MSDYETDVVRWSEKQAELLRQLLRGEKSNEVPDWANIIEEVEDVGRSELRAADSLLFQIILHLLKQAAWPDADATHHWQSEVRAALVQFGGLYRPSMRQRIDIARIYLMALATLPASNDGKAAVELPEQCPYTLESLLAQVPTTQARQG